MGPVRPGIHRITIPSGKIPPYFLNPAIVPPPGLSPAQEKLPAEKEDERVTPKPNFMQDPATSPFDGMPASAVQIGLARYILPAGKMYEAIAVCVKNYLVRKIMAPLPALGGKHPFIRILMLLRSRTGYDFSLQKQNSIPCPIKKRMSVQNLSDNRVRGIVRRAMSLNSRRIHTNTGDPRFILLENEITCPVPKKQTSRPAAKVIPS